MYEWYLGYFKSNFNAVDSCENTPFVYSALRDDVASLMLFDQAGADLKNYTNKHKKTLLHVAASSGKNEVVKFLLSKKVDLEPLDDNGDTPLYWAMKHKRAECERLLRAAGATLHKPIESHSMKRGGEIRGNNHGYRRRF